MNITVRATRLIGLLIVAMLAGCAGGVSKETQQHFNNLLAVGDYRSAENLAIASGSIKPDGKTENLIWSLQAGAAAFYAKDSATSVRILDGAEAMMKNIDLGGGSGQYKPKGFDGTMVNAYKGLSALALNNDSLARPEMFRTEERQRRAEEDFKKEIDALRANSQQTEGFNFNSALGAARNNPEYRKALQDISNYGGYQPFVNPFTTYLSALYFLNNADSDREKAKRSFQQVRGITKNAKLLDGDVALASSNEKFSPKVWVVFENGQSSVIEQYNITFPVPIVGRRSGISVATVAMPRLVEQPAATTGLLVGNTQELTTDVGNFDFVMRSEFQRRYPAILASAVLEAALKVALQNAAAQEKSGWALFAVALASNVSYAETRSWTALPKYFQAARVETPKDGVLSLRTANGRDLGVVNVPTDRSALVYVKMARAQSQPSVQVIKF